jgi:hypothetical protein
MKFLVAALVCLGLYLSLPHLQKLLLGVVVNQKVEQLMDGTRELTPLADPELPLESPELEEENNVAGEVALPLPIQ